MIAGLFIASLALRPQILAIGPLLPFIREDLGVSAGIAGFLTTIPVLCMGVFAPIGPRVAARLGPRLAFAWCLVLIVGFGIARAVAPDPLLVMAATLGIGIGIGVAGTLPTMMVSGRMATRPTLGTGAYAGGIVAGSTIAAAIAVPLAGGADGDWRRALAIVSIVSVGSLVAWLLLVRDDGAGHVRNIPVPHLPWHSGTAWLLVLVFGLQSILYYGAVAWLPNIYVERGWPASEAGTLLALFNATGLMTTLAVPLMADRLGTRRSQLVVASAVATGAFVGLITVPDLAYGWIIILGFALGAIFPLVLTLPLDVAGDPARVGSVAALMLLGGYILSAVGPVTLGAARDATGDFEASLWILVGVAVVLVASCWSLSPGRLHRGVHRDPDPSAA